MASHEKIHLLNYVHGVMSLSSFSILSMAKQLSINSFYELENVVIVEERHQYPLNYYIPMRELSIKKGEEFAKEHFFVKDWDVKINFLVDYITYKIIKWLYIHFHKATDRIILARNVKNIQLDQKARINLPDTFSRMEFHSEEERERMYNLFFHRLPNTPLTV